MLDHLTLCWSLKETEETVWLTTTMGQGAIVNVPRAGPVPARLRVGLQVEPIHTRGCVRGIGSCLWVPSGGAPPTPGLPALRCAWILLEPLLLCLPPPGREFHPHCKDAVDFSPPSVCLPPYCSRSLREAGFGGLSFKNAVPLCSPSNGDLAISPPSSLINACL